MTGAETIVQVLADEGVDTIFGYSGGAILPTYDAVFTFNQDEQRTGRHGLPLIVAANEQGAAFMAAGYARASGKVGVCMVTSGPGATNTLTPVRDCMADSVPIVVICGQVPTSAIGTDAFQEAPVPSIMGAVAKHVFLVTDPAKLEATVRTAFEIARTGRPGPVVIDVPKNVQNWSGPFDGAARLAVPGYRQRLARVDEASLAPEKCDELLAALAQSQRPLLYVGGGVIAGEAAASLREFASGLGIPAVTTLMGIGAVDTTDAQVLTSGGQVIQAFYSSSNGGYTERSDYVFSATLPYLVATPDPLDQATGKYMTVCPLYERMPGPPKGRRCSIWAPCTPTPATGRPR